MRNLSFVPKLFRRIDHEPFAPCIVGYAKKPYEEKIHEHYSTLDFAEEATRTPYISKYMHRLYVDLWFIKVKLEWLGREQKPPKL